MLEARHHEYANSDHDVQESRVEERRRVYNDVEDVAKEPRLDDRLPGHADIDSSK
jgi:hypothetical protein